MKNTRQKNNRVSHAEDPFLPLSAAARQIGKHPSTLKRWVLEGLIVAVQLPSGRFQIRQSQVDRYLGGSTIQES